MQEIQKEQYTEDSDNRQENHRRRRKRKRRRSKWYAIAGLAGCLAILVAVMYTGVWLWDRGSRPESEEAMADVPEILYTQQELDLKLKEAEDIAAKQAEAAADAKADEILGGIRQSLEDGTTMVETLRPYYPDKLVLASSGSFHFVPIREDLRKNAYEDANLNILENGEHQYLENGQVISHKGIDVSKHQGSIDWQQVAGDGVEFAFIRVALRGYGSEGKLIEDEYFEENIKGAIGAGIKVGVYLYSQAVNEEELLEEANLVLEKIAPYKIECPVVYDVEKVVGADGRMNSLSVEERTNLAVLFCQTVENAGYKPMIYHNMEMGALMIDLKPLENYEKWFAYYNDDFYYPYDYAVWQYSDKGRVNGVKGDVDLNISFQPLW